MKTIVCICGMITLVVTAGVAEAKKERYRDREEVRSGPTCQKMIKERGDRAFTRNQAVENAKKAWIIAAKNAHGVDYARLETAWTDPDSRVDNPSCFSDPERWAKKWECTYVAKPCLR